MTTPLDQTERDRFQRWVDTERPSLMKDAVIGDPYHAEVHVLDAAWEAWQAAIASRAIPEGWQLAPKKPNAVMHTVGGDCVAVNASWNGKNDTAALVYEAMLAVVPPTPQDPPKAAEAAKETT